MSINADESLQILEVLFASSDNNFYLTDIQEVVFLKSWERYSYQQIADSLGYDCDYIKKVGSQLWRLVSKALEKKVTKSNVHSLLRQYAVKNQTDLARLTKLEDVPSFLSKVSLTQDNKQTQNNLTNFDWGEANDVSNYYGRQAELNNLESWIIQDIETVLQVNGSLHVYPGGYEEYGELLRRPENVLPFSPAPASTIKDKDEKKEENGKSYPHRISFDLDSSQYKKLKWASFDSDRPMNDILREALEEWMKSRNY